ncbi:MAG: hypothetical protein MUC96_34615, partial [Myxococcaceae bacterium]|nr:hypothetical protein [Myxococcaceae bacterium]
RARRVARPRWQKLPHHQLPALSAPSRFSIKGPCPAPYGLSGRLRDPPWPFIFVVATDAGVIQFHRDHRDPEIQSVLLERFSALTDSAKFAQGHCARG